MARLQPAPGARSVDKRLQEAVDEGVVAVEASLAGASRKAIRAALVVELMRRGFPGFEPDRSLIDRIRAVRSVDAT